jgi:hypothetical protein
MHQALISFTLLRPTAVSHICLPTFAQSLAKALPAGDDGEREPAVSKLPEIFGEISVKLPSGEQVKVR